MQVRVGQVQVPELSVLDRAAELLEAPEPWSKLFLLACVCVCVCEREREGGRERLIDSVSVSEHLILVIVSSSI